jgi:hypothetical protein
MAQLGAAIVPRVYLRTFDLYMFYKGLPTYLLGHLSNFPVPFSVHRLQKSWDR